MIKKVLGVAALLMAASSMFAARIVVGVGVPAPVVVGYGAPPPPVAAGYVAPAPGPGYSWVGGYWYPYGGHWSWRAGYWGRRPYVGARWVAPRYYGRRFYGGYWRR